MKDKRKLLMVLVTLIVVAVLGVAGASGQEPVPESPDGEDTVARTIVRRASIYWEPQVAYESMHLTVTGPNGYVFHREFAPDQTIYFDFARQGVADGFYNYELQYVPLLSAETEAALAETTDREATVESLRLSGQLPAADQTIQSDSFLIQNSAVVTAEITEEELEFNAPQDINAPEEPLDQVILDDLIVDGSACVGFDCVNGESFGSDTIRVKENNLRIHFDDTSTSASFPKNDWRLIANDQSNGGAEYFGIQDATAGRIPFRVEAGAPNHSLYVDDGGRIGFGTSTPVVELHVVDGDTPTLRLQQDGSSGFTPQTWDVAGNEAGFFVRDVTNGSQLAFRILPGADSQSLVIAGDDDVGIGVLDPDASLEVTRSDGSAQILVDENSGTTAGRDLLVLENNGSPRYVLRNSNTGVEWLTFLLSDDGFGISQVGTGGAEFVINPDGSVQMGGPGAGNFTLDASGNLTVAGTVSGSSSEAVKSNLNVVEPGILESVMDLAIYTYNYNADDPSIVHMGTTAEDFYEAFGLGADDKHISLLDIAGVTMAALQEMNDLLLEKDALIAELQAQNYAQEKQIEELAAENEMLEARLTALEDLVMSMVEEQE